MNGTISTNYILQVDNMDLVKDKWTAIIKPFLDLVVVDAGPGATAAVSAGAPDNSMDEDSDSAGPSHRNPPRHHLPSPQPPVTVPQTSPSPSPPPSPPPAPRPPTSLANYEQRLKAAYAAYPLLFAEEEAFWSERPQDEDSAPFPGDTDTEGFVVNPQTFVAKQDPLSPTACWLLHSLDNTSAVRTSQVTVSTALASKVESMWVDEEDGRNAGGCKHGRDGTVLTLRSSAGPKAEGKVYYNPKTDVTNGECVLVRLSEALDTPASRGWELALITADATPTEGKARYQVRGILWCPSWMVI